MGKHHRSSYSSHDDIPSSAPFDLLHCNVWGPSRTPFISGHRYYIVFVDDYTRVSWVYLLSDRSEVVTTVTHFITKSSLNTRLCQRFFVLITLLSLFKPLYVPFTLIVTLFAKPLILTLTAKWCRRAKHCQLVDITRTLLIEMHVPSYLWFDALMIATYL